MSWPWMSAVAMDAPAYGSPVRKFVDDIYSMCLSNDVDRSDPVNLSSLGVVDLDTAIVPDVFGLRAFDLEKPITRMLPGHFPNELRVLIPDLGIARRGFMTLLLRSLAAPQNSGQAGVYPVTSLLSGGFGRGFCFAVCINVKEEMEILRHSCRDRQEWEFRQGHPGHCPQCHEYVATTLDRHMMNNHLELGQLWWCPVEWCTVWKGSMADCLSHLQEKHGGSQFVALSNLGKFSPCGLSPVHFGLRLFDRTQIARPCRSAVGPPLITTSARWRH